MVEEHPHLFVNDPQGRYPNSCVQCGRVPQHLVHIQVPEALPRLARSDLLMQVAELYAQRSSCNRGHVGAVLVRDGRIISAGYNGAPPGMAHCLDVGCDVPDCNCEHSTPRPEPPDKHHEDCASLLGCQRTIHAEANAIVWSARMGVPTLDSAMYSTHSPCATCARLLVAAGICKLYYRNDYRLARLDILDQACVLVEKL